MNACLRVLMLLIVYAKNIPAGRCSTAARSVSFFMAYASTREAFYSVEKKLGVTFLKPDETIERGKGWKRSKQE